MISHGATDVKVSLDFRVNGASYRVARRMRKAGQGHSIQFVHIDGDHEVPVCDSSGVVGINKAIEGVLGLDFSAFTKAVLLPQGDFHEFLKGDASARRKILVDLLDLNRYLSAGGRARSQAHLLTARLDEREKLIASEYGDATGERLKEAKAGAKSAKAGYAELQMAEERAKAQADAAKAAESVIERASAAEGAFGQLAEDVDDFRRELAALNERHEAEAAAALAAVKAAQGRGDAREPRRQSARGDDRKRRRRGGDCAAASRRRDPGTETGTLETLTEQLAALIAAVVAGEEAHAGAIETREGD